MKTILITGAMVTSILSAGCNKSAPSGPAYSQVSAPPQPLSKLVPQSTVIAYAKADTNGLPRVSLVVADIWKGSHEASRLGITNGLRLLLLLPFPASHPPDGAVIFFPTNSVPPDFFIRSVYSVYDGRVDGMSIEKFRYKFGL
jgi:hypothetical protein